MSENSNQHLLPATFLARFAFLEKTPRRRSCLFVGDRLNNRVFDASAQKVGTKKEFYSPLVDDVWSGYESRLNVAINNLVNRKIDAVEWLRVVVPFVTALLVRSEDFNTRFKSRFEGLGIEPAEWNIDRARLFELQRLLSAVLVANWLILRVSKDPPLILNDKGWTPGFDPITKRHGMAIPLDTKHVLLVTPCRAGSVVYADGEVWRPTIMWMLLLAH